MTHLGRFAVALMFALVALSAAGCGGTELDVSKTEPELEQYLENSVGQEVASVDCPSGVEVKADETFDCSISLTNGKHETATIKILNEDADIEVARLQPDK